MSPFDAPPWERRPTSLRVAARPQHVAATRAFIRNVCHDNGCPPELTARAVLAVSEAVTNAVIHAFIDCPIGQVTVGAHLNTDDLLVTVTDDGRGMQPRPDSPGLGLGLSTITHTCNALAIHPGRNGQGTQLTMRFTR